MRTMAISLGLFLTCQASSFGVSLPVVRQFAAPGAASEGMAFVGSELWVWDVWGPSQFFILNPQTGLVERSYSTPSSSGGAGLAFDGSSLWAVSADAAFPPFIARFNAADGSLIEYGDLPVGNPTGIAFDGDSLWIAETDTHRLVKVDRSTLSVREELYQDSLLTMNLAWDGSYLWLLGYDCSPDGTNSYLSRVDPATGATLARYETPARGAVGMTFNDGQLYISDVTTRTIYVLQTPEPAMALTFGLFGILLLSRRR